MHLKVIYIFIRVTSNFTFYSTGHFQEISKCVFLRLFPNNDDAYDDNGNNHTDDNGDDGDDVIDQDDHDDKTDDYDDQHDDQVDHDDHDDYDNNNHDRSQIGISFLERP